MLVGTLGVIAALVAAGGAAVAVQNARFRRRVAAEVRALFECGGEGRAADAAALARLPAPVRRYVEVSGAAAHRPVRTAWLRHGGFLRTSLEGRWFAIRGVQAFTADPPGFVWWGRVRAAPGVWIDARDRSEAGEAGFLVRLASTITLAEAHGREFDEGALMRVLGELTWLPTAYLDDRWISWEPVDETSARATLRVSSRVVSVTFRFGPDGLPEELAALRYRDVKGQGVLTPWTARCGDFREVDGLRVPFRVESIWHVDGRACPVIRFTVERLDLDAVEPTLP